MSTFLLLTVTGLGLGAMYFLIASGLSLIYGLMGVLNFAHGAFVTVGAYAMWFTESKLTGLPPVPRFLVGSLIGLAVGGLFAALVELFLIRPLYRRHIEQVLVTVGSVCRPSRWSRRSGGTTRASSRHPPGSARRRRSAERTYRTTAGSRSPSPSRSSRGWRHSCATRGTA
jgi:hypothetical protein